MHVQSPFSVHVRLVHFTHVPCDSQALVQKQEEMNHYKRGGHLCLLPSREVVLLIPTRAFASMRV